MSRYFEPSLSYRMSERGGGVREFGQLSQAGLLTQGRPLVFFVHGFNTDQPGASASYQRFLALLGGVTSVVIGVYWPGDSWAGPANYMHAVQLVPTIARRFARDLHTAALGSGRFEISFVCHSLGSRLTIETLRELADLRDRQPAPSLQLRRVVFMAGAIPTSRLEVREPFNRAIHALDLQVKSLYSEADDVLHFAFPPGETLAGAGFFPTALGRRRWGGADVVQPPLVQAENSGAGHSDYWGGDSPNADRIAAAAREVQTFIPLGGPAPPRATPSRDTTSARRTSSERSTASRTV